MQFCFHLPNHRKCFNNFCGSLYSARFRERGRYIFVPVYRHPLNQTQLAGYSYNLYVSYDASILLPIGVTGGVIDTIGNGYAVFTINNAPDTAYIECIVGLGDSAATLMQIDSLNWGCAAHSARLDGLFSVTGLCAQGGTRLFISDSGIALSQNDPNPFSGSTMINFPTIENGETRLWIADVLGRVQAVLAEGYLRAGSYESRLMVKECRRECIFMRCRLLRSI